ncbi:MAG: carboxypeptidase-like regulatory domain-containing protein, partial [Chitinophagaceae bacterium]
MRKLKLLKVGIVLFIVLLISATGIAQKKITGFVQDATTNLPLNGATISVQNSKIKALSKEGGKFEINTPSGISSLTLLISFVGYETRTVKVSANSSNLVVNLDQSASNSLDDVVVIGYGTKKKVNLTGAISTVTAKEIESRPISNTQQGLQGLVPNLNISVSNAGGEPG